MEKKQNHDGTSISLDAIVTVAASAALDCYGVVGLTSKSSLSGNINEVLRKENFSKGVVARKTKSGAYSVDLHLVLVHGVKITEIIAEVQKQVKYVLETTFDMRFHAINVYVQSIKEML
ncbi:MAG: Asp23/Gls24 family envelope stress response protein [Bacilli bacterium]|jgi:uncharacterized alkaline shock family protein YloU